MFLPRILFYHYVGQHNSQDFERPATTGSTMAEPKYENFKFPLPIIPDRGQWTIEGI